jgi:hypothetical protein
MTITSNTGRPPLGIIQSRGLGDIFIALPIAKHYHDLGHHVIWPICQEFYSAVKDTVTWVEWVPIPADPMGKFFYDRPYFELGQRGCSNIICLYQALTGHPEFSSAPWFQIQKFDEYKYTRASVPFYKKWTLGQCFRVDPQRVTELTQHLNIQGPYYILHRKGSNYLANPDLSALPPEWRCIDPDQHPGWSPFEWVDVIKSAEAFIGVDSAWSNLVDQLDLPVDKYWMPRSHIHLTPVLGSTWTILEPAADTLAARPIFQAQK